MAQLVGFAALQVVFTIIGIFAYWFGRDMISIYPMLLLTIPAYAALLMTHPKKGLLFLGLISVYSTLIEATSVATGFPYGFFAYGANLGSKLFDLVPWTVSFGWVPLVISSVFLAQTFFIRSWHRALATVILLLITDLVLDPGAVAMSFWTWVTTGPYYTVPWVNFFGWVLSGLVGVGLWQACIGFSAAKLPRFSVLSLALGNAFWIGVTFAAGMYIAMAIGLVFAALIVYSCVVA